VASKEKVEGILSESQSGLKDIGGGIWHAEL
jgi:hypothetical protein